MAQISYRNLLVYLCVTYCLQLPRHMLLRYCYVPFVTKRLSPETLVPLPKFRKQQQRAGPASTGGPPAAAASAAASQSAAGPSAGGATGAVSAPPAAGTPGQTKQQQQQYHTKMDTTLQVVTNVQPSSLAWQQQQQQPQLVNQITLPVDLLMQAPQVPVPSAEVYTKKQLQQSKYQQAVDQEQASMMLLQPQLHQLPPRGRKQSVLQEQTQQQIVRQQLISAARLVGTTDSAAASVDARIAAGIAAYGNCGSVVGVSGVSKQLP